MTIEQVDNLLPNGFHDAEIRQLLMDYASLRLVLRLNLLIGLPDDDPPKTDAYRAGEVVFEDVSFFQLSHRGPNLHFAIRERSDSLTREWTTRS